LRDEYFFVCLGDARVPDDFRLQKDCDGDCGLLSFLYLKCSAIKREKSNCRFLINETKRKQRKLNDSGSNIESREAQKQKQRERIHPTTCGNINLINEPLHFLKSSWLVRNDHYPHTNDTMDL
jgi:hypothetical protein